MDGKSSKLIVETCDGRQEEFRAYKDVMLPEIYVDWLNREFSDHIRDIINFDIHKNDVFLATYLKAGSHWAWEIISMLLQGSAAYMPTDKEVVHMDMVSADKIAQVPSPRVLNSHFTPRCIPRGIIKNGVKIVHVQRNAKDVLVSLYNHLKAEKCPFTENFETFFKLFIGSLGVYIYCSWVHYVKEWESFTKQHPDQILNLYYEDMIEDPVREIGKINTFLECNRSEDLVREIADVCSFAKLKEADADKKHEFDLPVEMFRKGQVGDWKNWLTVAQNEEMDEWLQETFTNTDLKFRYTL